MISMLTCRICLARIAAIAALCTSAYADDPAPSGNIAYIHDTAVYVSQAADGNAEAIKIPRSGGSISFSMSPGGDGTIVFFAPRTNARGPRGGSGPELSAFFSRPPYHDSEAVPLFVGKDDDISVTWTADGDAEIGVGDLNTRRLDPKTGQLSIENDVAPKSPSSRRRANRTGNEIAAYTDGDGRLLLSRQLSGAETVLFSPKSPAAMFAALKRARNPANLKTLTDEVDPTLWKDAHNWSVGVPALTPDKKLVLFASNLGTGMGAQGNTSFCLFTADVATGRLAVLSKAGQFFGRVPIDSEVSSDGLRLFFTTSAHSSAADNSFSGYVVDLETQQTREIIRSNPAHATDANLTGGWTWSPDGRFLAIAVLYYNAKTVSDDREPNLSDSTIYIKDAATGRTIRQIPHAKQPVWTK